MKKLLCMAAIALFVAGCSGSGKTDDSSKNDSACSTSCACNDTASEPNAVESAQSAYEKANGQFKKEKYKEAIASAETALELAANYDDARELIGLAYFRLGEWQKSQGAFDAITETAPDEQKYRTRAWTAQCMFRLNNFEGTLDVLDELAGHEALDHIGHNLRGYALIELGRNDEAIKALELAIALAPEGDAKKNYETALKQIQK
ncbi:MAG: tetratricopeptide repeat protein [Planctomycetota bacterium]